MQYGGGLYGCLHYGMTATGNMGFTACFGDIGICGEQVFGMVTVIPKRGESRLQTDVCISR